MSGKLKINIIDVIIIVAVVSGLIWFFGMRGNETAVYDEEVFALTYTTPSYPEFVPDYFKAGDTLEDFIKGGSLGFITGIEISEGFDVRAGTDGIMRKSPKEGYVQLTVESEVTGRKAENGIIINGNVYFVGQNVTMRAGEGKLFIMLAEIRRKN